MVLAAALFACPKNANANRCLGLLLLVLTGMTWVHVFGWTGRADISPALAFTPVKLPLALGPLLHAYLHALIRNRLPRRLLWHMAPVGLLVAYLTTVLLLPAEVRFAWKETVHDDWVKPVIEAAALVSLTAYNVAGLRLLKRYRIWLSQARSDADRYGARWFRQVLVTLLATAVMLAGVRFYAWFVSEFDTGWMQIWLAGFGAFVGIQGLRTADRAFPIMAEPAVRPADASQDWAALGHEWRTRTSASGWWREHDLTLADLARRLGTNSNYLSHAINDGLGMNFNEMINRMRAEEVARRLGAGEPASMSDLAHEAGCSSKATFNRAFCAAYGVSPTARRAQAQIQKDASVTAI